MRPPRLSIRGLMMWVVGFAFVLMGLRFSTPIMATAVLLLTIFVFGMAIIAIGYRRESRRSFWIGFALMGCGYMWLSSGSWTITVHEMNHSGMGSGMRGGPPPPTYFGDWLRATPLLDALRPSVQASNAGAGTPSNRTASVFGFMDPQSGAIHSALKQSVAMPFAQETSLDEVLEYIKTATIGKDLPKGIPIYVDPIGLVEAEKTMKSPISLELDGIPLSKSLTLILKQLDLAYVVDDGLMTITCVVSDSPISDRIESFRRVGHSLIALLFGLLGGFAARVLHATREPLSHP